VSQVVEADRVGELQSRGGRGPDVAAEPVAGEVAVAVEWTMRVPRGLSLPAANSCRCACAASRNRQATRAPGVLFGPPGEVPPRGPERLREQPTSKLVR
jgi:hypothetical protein